MQITLRVDGETAVMLRQETREAGGTVAELVAEMVLDQPERAWGNGTTAH